MPQAVSRRSWECGLFMGASMVIPILVVGVHFPFKEPALEVWVDLAIRLLFLGIVVWLRLALLPDLRNPPLGRWAMVLLPIAVLLLHRTTIQGGGLKAVCAVMDCVIQGLLIAMVLEVIVAAMARTIAPNPKQHKIASIERLQHLRAVIDIQKRLVLAITVLILLALYVLARSYLFDWIIYARIGAVLTGLSFILPLMVLNTRSRRNSETELARVETEIENAIERQLFRFENGLEPSGGEELSFWLDYRRVIVQSTVIPISWENWLYLAFLLLVILVEPYLFGLWMI